MKDKGKFWIIISVATFVVILAIILSLYFLTDVFKSNKEIFNKYLIQAQSKSTGTDFIEAYMNAKIKEYTNSNSTSTDVNLYSININNAEDKTKIVGLNTTSLKDVNLKQDYKMYKLSDNTNNLATVKYVRDGNLHAISAENILTRYIAIDINNIKTVAQKLGVPVTEEIPDKIEDIDYNKLLSVNKTAINDLKQKYMGIIVNNIEEEKYSKVKNEDKTESIILTLTNQDLANILEALLQEAKNDETFLNLIKDKVNATGNNIEISTIQNKLNEALEQLENTNIPEGQVKISLIVKDKEIIKYIIEIPEINNDEIFIAAQSIELKFENDNRIIINMKSGTEEYRINVTYMHNDNILTIDAKLYYIEAGKESEVLNLKNEILNFNTDKITETININAYIYDEKYELEVKKDTIFKQDLQIEKLTTENSTRIDTMTDEQLKGLAEALTQRITQLYGKQINSLALLQMMKVN